MPSRVRAPIPEGTPLTKREEEVMRFACKGVPSREIAGYLGIKRGTVERHVERICVRLGADSRTEAAYLLGRAGFEA